MTNYDQESLLNKLQKINEENTRRFNRIQKYMEDNSEYLPHDSRKLEKNLLRKINNFIPFPNIERRAKMTDGLQVAGRTFRDSNGVRHPLVSKYIGTLSGLDKSFIYANPKKTPRARDYLENLLAHEYGHIIFDQNMVSKVRTPEASRKKNIYLEIGEAYAFWFSEQVTDFNSPIRQLEEKYNKKMNFRNSIEMYEDFLKSSKEEMFSPDYLKEIIKKYLDKK